jgi:filamentous hemagglutinin family protein
MEAVGEASAVEWTFVTGDTMKPGTRGCFRHRRALAGLLGAASIGAYLAGGAAQSGGVSVDKTLCHGSCGVSGPNYQIHSTLGQQLGSNLFFSFSSFNLASGQSATFFSPFGTNNVISRVTGGGASSINGLIQSLSEGTNRLSSANFYFINPAGVILGPGASLNVGGAFHVSTAHYLSLADGGSFNAANPGASSLSSAEPAAFGFLGGQGSIQVSSRNLKVAPGQTLSLIGGTLDINNAVLSAPGGRINIAGTAGAGMVALTDNGISTGGVSPGAVTVENGSTLSVDSPASGSLASGLIYANAGVLTVDGSTLSSNNSAASGGGGITLVAGSVSLLGGGRVETLSYGPGAGGDIGIVASKSVTVDGTDGSGQGSHIAADALGSGAAGSVSIQSPLLTISHRAAISSDTLGKKAGAGAGGLVSIDAGTVSVLNGGYIETSSYGAGAGGDVRIVADHSVTLDGTDGGQYISYLAAASHGTGAAGSVSIRSPALTVSNDAAIASDSRGTMAGAGPGGAISIDAGTVSLLGGGSIQTLSDGPGAGGDISIAASNSVTVDGTDGAGHGSYITADAHGTGAAGSVSIQGPALTVSHYGVVSSASRGTAVGAGGGGQVTVNAGTVAVLSGGEISTLSRGPGAGGGISIAASKSITVDGTDGRGHFSFVSADSYGSGDAGSISIQSPALVVSHDAVVSSNSHGTGVGAGPGGQISINAGMASVLSGGSVQTSSYGPGAGGDIGIVASQSVTVDGTDGGGHGSFIAANAYGSGAAGSVSIRSPLLTISHRAAISSDTLGKKSDAGAGGLVSIDAGTVSVLNGGYIETSSYGPGAGGDIRIVADKSVILDGTDGGSYISFLAAASHGTGAAGSVSIRSPALTVSNDAAISSNSRGAMANAGSGGEIAIDAGTVSLLGGGSIQTLSDGSGGGGDISIAAGNSVTVDGTDGRGHGSYITADAHGTGAAGSISIQSPALTISRYALVSSASRGTMTGAGAGGQVSINAGTVAVLSGGEISTLSRGPGAGGDISIAAGNGVTVDGTDPSGHFSLVTADAYGTGAAGSVSIHSPALTVSHDAVVSSQSYGTMDAAGRGGDLSLNLGTLTVTNGGEISAQTSGSGKGGSIDVKVANALSIRGGNAASPTGILAGTTGAGSGGDIAVSAAAIDLSGGGEISVSSQGPGSAGTIGVTASGMLAIDGNNQVNPSGIFAEAQSSGDGGDITVSAQNISLSRQGEISSSSFGSGNGGSITVGAADSLQILDGGQIATQTTQSDGGNISIQVGKLIYLDASSITTSVSGGRGNGGNITIDPLFVVLNRGSRLIANAHGGNGGNITIRAEAFVPSADSLVQASSDFSKAGTISILSPVVDVGQWLGLLPANYLDVSRLVHNGCPISGKGSSFIAAGRGGLPLSGADAAYPSWVAPMQSPAAALTSPVARAGLPQLAGSPRPACASLF